MKKRIHVVGAVIVDKGLIYCARRGPHAILAGMWEFPGGKVEANESDEEALSREILEELGCDVKVGMHLDTTTHEYDFGIVELSLYFCELVNGRPNSNEHDEQIWLNPEELNSLDWAPADRPAVAKLEAQIG